MGFGRKSAINYLKNSLESLKRNTIKIITGLIAVLFLATSHLSFGQSQKYAFVDTEYILDNIPEFQDAQDELDDLSVKWQKEIEALYTEVEEMYNKYQAESVLLPDDIKKKREDEIIQKEQEVKELQRKYFGPQGELYKTRQELVQPIQEKVFNAIETIANTRNYSFIFDKAGGMTLLYSSPLIFNCVFGKSVGAI